MSFGRKLKIVDKQTEDGHYTLQKYLSTPATGAGEDDEADNGNGEPLSWEDQLITMNQDMRSQSKKRRTGVLNALDGSCDGKSTSAQA